MLGMHEKLNRVMLKTEQNSNVIFLTHALIFPPSVKMQGEDQQLDIVLLQRRIKSAEVRWYNAVRANLQSLRFNEDITNIRFELHPTGSAAQEVALTYK